MGGDQAQSAIQVRRLRNSQVTSPVPTHSVAVGRGREGRKDRLVRRMVAVLRLAEANVKKALS